MTSHQEPETLNIADIIVDERLRKDYGTLEDLDTISIVGLIQPVVLSKESDGTYRLVAGGRRLNKLGELGFTTLHHKITCDPQRPGYVFAYELPEDVRREVELYENIGRRQMDWKERVLSIEEIHNLKMRKATLDREEWGMRETGAELGVALGHLSDMIRVARELRKGGPITECKHLRDAFQYLLRVVEDEAKANLAKMTTHGIATPAPAPSSAVRLPNETASAAPLVVPLSQMLVQGDCTTLMNAMPPDSVDHIISDWPYAIDMSNLQQQGTGMDVSRVEDTHDVDKNLTDYPGWLSAMYRVLRPGGFCVLFYDNVHFSLIREWAEYDGFQVQRWPFVWVKTSPCLNQSAFKNFTKATEFAIVMRKGNATAPKALGVNYWSGARASGQSNPFAKPDGLWTHLYTSLCLPGQSVLDPFAGEGSSTVAAIRYGLRPLAFESDTNHFNQLVLNVRDVYTQLTKANVTFT